LREFREIYLRFDRSAIIPSCSVLFDSLQVFLESILDQSTALLGRSRLSFDLDLSRSWGATGRLHLAGKAFRRSLSWAISLNLNVAGHSTDLCL